MKKLTAFLLCLCLMAPTLPVQAAQDAPAWAAEAYEALEERSVLRSHRTSGAINRGAFTGLLVALLDGAVPSAALQAYPQADNTYFADSSYNSAVLRAAGYGILEGSLESDGLRYAHTDRSLTRQEAAKLVVSLLDFFVQKLGYSLEPSGSGAVYADADTIAGWALPFTQTIAAYGLMKGDEQGNFNPQGELDWPSAVVMGDRLLALMDGAVGSELKVLPLQSQISWSGASRFGAGDYSISRPKTGWVTGYYTIGNADGTVSGLVVDTDSITAERFDQTGALVSSKSLEMELPTFGTFFDSGEHFYLVFGQANSSLDDNQEVFRIVQYDRDWNRLGAVSVNGKDSYTDEPFRSAVARMAVSENGKTVTLYAARKRYDGHQSNITFIMNTSPFSIKEVKGQQFPSNHVSHSFGQFIQYDGERMVTVDHGDAYPRSFVFQDGSREVDLLKIYGKTGENVTNAIGSGFEVSDDGYLFLGCSDPQDGSKDRPWNVFLTYLGKSGKDVEFTWLTQSETAITCARLVKLDGDTFVAMWQEGDDIHWLKLNGMGAVSGEEQVLANTLMPTTQPVVIDGGIYWIQTSSIPQYQGKALLCHIEVE